MRQLGWQLGLRIGAPLAAAALILVGWWAVVTYFEIQPFLAPTPQQVGMTLWADRAELLAACRMTAKSALGGLAMSVVTGTVIGVLFAKSRWLRYSLYPYAIFLQTVPIVAVAPLLVMWFGYGRSGVMAVAFILSFFPVVANVTAGMLAVPVALEDLFRLHHANGWQRLWKLQLPHTIPSLMTGVKTSSGLSVIGAIVGEFFVGYGGEGYVLGYLIRTGAESYRTDGLFAAVLLSTAWHDHEHATAPCTAENLADQHEHGHHHGHGHHHQHGHSHAEGDSRQPCPAPHPPHDSDDCQSCQFLSIPSAIAQHVDCPRVERAAEPQELPLHSADSADPQRVVSLRGPPALRDA